MTNITKTIAFLSIAKGMLAMWRELTDMHTPDQLKGTPIAGLHDWLSVLPAMVHVDCVAYAVSQIVDGLKRKGLAKVTSDQLKEIETEITKAFIVAA